MHELDAQGLYVDDFQHVARWNPVQHRVEMWLRAAARRRRCTSRAIDRDWTLPAGGEMLTEISVKFRLPELHAELHDHGLDVGRVLDRRRARVLADPCRRAMSEVVDLRSRGSERDRRPGPRAAALHAADAGPGQGFGVGVGGRRTCARSRRRSPVWAARRAPATPLAFRCPGLPRRPGRTRRPITTGTPTRTARRDRSWLRSVCRCGYVRSICCPRSVLRWRITRACMSVTWRGSSTRTTRPGRACVQTRSRPRCNGPATTPPRWVARVTTVEQIADARSARRTVRRSRARVLGARSRGSRRDAQRRRSAPFDPEPQQLSAVIDARVIATVPELAL